MGELPEISLALQYYEATQAGGALVYSPDLFTTYLSLVTWVLAHSASLSHARALTFSRGELRLFRHPFQIRPPDSIPIPPSFLIYLIT